MECQRSQNVFLSTDHNNIDNLQWNGMTEVKHQEKKNKKKIVSGFVYM